MWKKEHTGHSQGLKVDVTWIIPICVTVTLSTLGY